MLTPRVSNINHVHPMWCASPPKAPGPLHGATEPSPRHAQTSQEKEVARWQQTWVYGLKGRGHITGNRPAVSPFYCSQAPLCVVMICR